MNAINPGTIETEGLRASGLHDARWVTGDRVFLDLGSRATTPDVPSLGALRPMTHVEALDLDPCQRTSSC